MQTSDEILDQFPLLKSRRARGPFAYLDNAATTQKPEVVINAVRNFYVSHNSNVHRGVYDLAAEATELYESARESVADFLQTPPTSVSFTSGATAGLNLLATGLEERITADDTILISELEHHANILPWMRLAKRTGARLAWIPINDDGSIDAERATDCLRRHQVKIVALTGLSHVLGNRPPVREIFFEAQRRGAFTVLDASQSISRTPHFFDRLACDALVFSGHKIYAPTGIGVLALSERFAREVQPLMLGGGMAEEVSKLESRWRQAPYRFEGGTPAIEAAIALGEALRFALRMETKDVAQREIDLIENLAQRLARDPAVHLYGWANALQKGEITPPHAGILSFNVDGWHAHDLAEMFAEVGIAVRAGAHCAQPLMERLRTSATVRVSLAPYNSVEDIQLLCQTFESREQRTGTETRM